MQVLINFFSSIADFILAVGRFLYTLVSDIVYMITLLLGFIAEIPKYLGFFPSTVITLIITALSLWVILRLIGKD